MDPMLPAVIAATAALPDEGGSLETGTYWDGSRWWAEAVWDGPAQDEPDSDHARVSGATPAEARANLVAALRARTGAGEEGTG